MINPITARYVDRLVDEGEQRGIAALVIVIDTPGGLIDSTYKITGRMLNAGIPILTYVAPSGAHAASAGTFITLAGHVAAMAPSTNIGAAHPVDGWAAHRGRSKDEVGTTPGRSQLAARGANAHWAEPRCVRRRSGADEALA